MTIPTIGPALANAGNAQPVVPTGQLPPAQQPTAPQVVELVTGLDISPYLKLFIHGDINSGKTILAATAPAPIFLDTENSSDTLRDWPKLADRCRVIRMKWEHTDQVLEGLKSKSGIFKDRDTVVLDTADALQRNNLEFILKASGRDQFLPMEHDYKKSGEMLRRFILELRDLDMHVIVIAHTKEITPEGTSLHLIRPGVTPKLAQTLTEEFSFVGYMAVSGLDPFENVLQSRGGNPTIQVKSRFRYLPSIVTNPTFRDIYNAANKYKELDQSTENQEPVQ